MGLADFKDKKREEFSLTKVAHAILEDYGKRMAFTDIVSAVQKYLDTSDEEVRERLPQFYTDMDTDGEFISVRDNVWALRLWFLYRSVDEEVNHPEDEDGKPHKKHHRRASVFIASSGDDDIIDYDSDGPENDDLDTEDNGSADDFNATDDDDFNDVDDDDELPDSIEGQLSELDDEDDEDDE